MAAYTARAAEKRRQGKLAHVLTVSLSWSCYAAGVAPAGGSFSHAAVLTLPVPTSDTQELTARAGQLLQRIWEPGAVYVKAGVVLAGLEAPGLGQQLGLFAAGPAAPVAAAPAAPARNLQLMATLNGLNERYGRGTVQLAAALKPKGSQLAPWQGQAA